MRQLAGAPPAFQALPVWDTWGADDLI